jgi:hypothetical protein
LVLAILQKLEESTETHEMDVNKALEYLHGVKILRDLTLLSIIDQTRSRIPWTTD